MINIIVIDRWWCNYIKPLKYLLQFCKYLFFLINLYLQNLCNEIWQTGLKVNPHLSDLSLVIFEHSHAITTYVVIFVVILVTIILSTSSSSYALYQLLLKLYSLFNQHDLLLDFINCALHYLQLPVALLLNYFLELLLLLFYKLMYLFKCRFYLNDILLQLLL